MLWENLREEEFAKAIEESKGVCVMPIGCHEMHGQHLPVNTDVLIADYVAKKAAEIEPVCVFPAFDFGDIQGIHGHKGTVMLTVETLQWYMTELCREIARNGFKKIIILNAHGGNGPFLHNFIRSTQHDKKDYVVLARNSFAYEIVNLAADIDNGVDIPELTDEDKKYVTDFVHAKKHYGHACIEETSQILAIAPELVRMDRMTAVDGLSTHKADYLHEVGFGLTSQFWKVNYPNSYSGHHHEGANARIGHALLNRQIKIQAEACRRLKMDDRVLEWNDEWNNAW